MLLTELLARGVYIAFDNLGREPAIAAPSLTAQCADAVPHLIEAGYLERVLLSLDICYKTSLKAFGGVGFTFLQDAFLPRLREIGVSEEQVQTLVVANPARAFTFTAPRP